jgi:hypothetical protein
MKLTASAEHFLSKVLGTECLEELHKFELYKLQTNTVLDHEEVRTALQIVPRTVLSLLQRELAPMKPSDNKSIKLPVSPEATLQLTKMSNDVYTGNIHQNGKIVAKFTNRSLPGIGLVIMSTFELYDMDSLVNMPIPQSNSDVTKIQAMIDERIGLHHLVRQVVDQRLSEREALEHIIRTKLTQAIAEASLPKNKEDSLENNPEAMKPKKEPKLKSFLDKKESKRNRPEFHVVLDKNEEINCPDCGKEIFMKGAYSGCICFGDDRNNKIYIKKTESGFSMRFPKSWDAENIQMLLDTLRSKNRSKV